MITMQLEGLDRIQAKIERIKGDIPRNIEIAANKTAKNTMSWLAAPRGPIQQDLKITSKGIKRVISTPRFAIRDKVPAVLNIGYRGRPSLKDHYARQIKAGVSYQIKKTGGRQLIEGAFGPNIDRLGNHVYKRRYPYVSVKKGGDRQRNREIVKLYGISIQAVIKKNYMMARDIVPYASQRMLYELDRRIRATTRSWRR